ncbi:MAG: 50S ribosomal protein L30e [Candidatus Helarchaeota archaeon]|nr:50S ribosomal protein L30e [Candidatus Helarchaeota archaeon]
MINVENAIKIATKTGFVQIGSKKSIRLVKNEEAKLVLVANNCPKEILEDLKIYCKFSNIPIYQYKGSNWDLGFLCGKPFMISVLSIIDAGDSDILKLKEESSN